MKSKRKFSCPGCGKHKVATRHHIFPRRWFPCNRKENKHYSYLCRDCHDKLEKLIEKEEFEKGGEKRKPLTRRRYVTIVDEFFSTAWEHA